MHLEGDVEGLDWLTDDKIVNADILDLPAPPRKWGASQRSIVGQGFVSPTHYTPTINPSSLYRSLLGRKNDGSVDLTLKVGKLRSDTEYLFDDPELFLVLPVTRESHVQGAWQITASGHDEIYAGGLQVEVGTSIDLTQSMRGLLRLDAK